ncbi:FecR family protein [Paradesertivirga mongoliensis]|uniref:FecR family protein n=1 Tax=Paradesertivirga mongoliensis TaxID=2100740 RepID=A0ABW4ZSD7_9SPHI|nr:FecR family protein [Pedobacter mongoliensis]
MLKDYTDYDLVDFLSDDSFVDWATGKLPEMDDFWSAWPQTYPHKAEIYHQAIEIASSLKIKPSGDLSQAEVASLVHKLVSSANMVQEEKTNIRQLRWYRKDWLRVAAAALIIASIAAMIYQRDEPLPGSNPQVAVKIPVVLEVTTPGIIRLADNSTVVLKKGSKIRYASSFSKSAREVYLEGEAFFEVTKDAGRPFIVRTNELITKVLGTSFSVRAYKEDKEFNVTVNTGKVSVFAGSGVSENSISSKTLERVANGGVLISPNQQVTFYRSATKLIKKKLAVPTTLSMEVAEVKLNFVDTPFSEVVAALSEAYDIKINYDEKRMGNCPLTASLSKQQLYEKLDLICQAVEAKYRIEEGHIVIDGKGCTN